MSAKKRDRAKRAYTAEYEQAIKDEMGRVAPEDELGAHRAKGEAGEQRGVLAQIHESFDGQNDIVETYEFTVRPLIGDDAFSSGLGRYTYTIKCRRVIPPFSLDGVWVLDDMRFVSKEEVTS
jgi:hypothetical protein